LWVFFQSNDGNKEKQEKMNKAYKEFMGQTNSFEFDWEHFKKNRKDIAFVIKTLSGNYVGINGGGTRALILSKLAVEELPDRKFKVVKDKTGKYGVGTIITEEELFLEVL
jgi:hypothetical protein